MAVHYGTTCPAAGLCQFCVEIAPNETLCNSLQILCMRQSMRRLYAKKAKNNCHIKSQKRECRRRHMHQICDFYLWRSRAGLGLLSWRSCCCCYIFQDFLYLLYQASYKNIYENKVVDTSVKGYCAKFEPNTTSTFATRHKKILVFLGFGIFAPFWPQNWPQNSNLTWSTQHNLGLPNLFVFIFFVRALHMPQNFI